MVEGTTQAVDRNAQQRDVQTRNYISDAAPCSYLVEMEGGRPSRRAYRQVGRRSFLPSLEPDRCQTASAIIAKHSPTP